MLTSAYIVHYTPYCQIAKIKELMGAIVHYKPPPYHSWVFEVNLMTAGLFM